MFWFIFLKANHHHLKAILKPEGCSEISNINNLQSSGIRNFYFFHSPFLLSSNITHMLALYNIKTLNNMNVSYKKPNKLTISVKTKFLIYGSVLWEKRRESESCLTDIAHFVYCTTGRWYIDILRWWGWKKKVSRESSREREKCKNKQQELALRPKGW